MIMQEANISPDSRISLRFPSEESFHLNSIILKTKHDLGQLSKPTIFTVEDIHKKRVFSLEDDLDVFLRSKGVDYGDMPLLLPSMCKIEKASDTSGDSITEGQYKSLIKLRKIRKKKKEKKQGRYPNAHLTKRIRTTRQFWRGDSTSFPVCFQLKTAEFSIKDFSKKHISLSDSIEHY